MIGGCVDFTDPQQLTYILHYMREQVSSPVREEGFRYAKHWYHFLYQESYKTDSLLVGDREH